MQSSVVKTLAKLLIYRSKLDLTLSDGTRLNLKPHNPQNITIKQKTLDLLLLLRV